MTPLMPRLLMRSPATPAMPLETYAGVYGDRTVEVADGRLLLRRGNRPPARLVALGPNLFAPEVAPAQRVGFVTDEGAVTALELVTGIITEKGVVMHPTREKLQSLISTVV